MLSCLCMRRVGLMLLLPKKCCTCAVFVLFASASHIYRQAPERLSQSLERRVTAARARHIGIGSGGCAWQRVCMLCTRLCAKRDSVASGRASAVCSSAKTIVMSPERFTICHTTTTMTTTLRYGTQQTTTSWMTTTTTTLALCTYRCCIRNHGMHGLGTFAC